MHTEHHLRAEFYNAVTHGLGAFLSVVGGIVLTTLAVLYGNGWQIASAIIFSLSLIGLYGASTLYHSTHDPVAKKRYKILDHCMIYVLIAGSYTPFTLIALRDDGGWWLFGISWSIALAGIIVRNSILLVDFIELQVAQGMAFQDAVVSSAAVRAQPIALTGLAAMIGAFFILDDPIFNGLAISLIFGIFVSTLLTLVVVPAVYSLVENALARRQAAARN